MEVLHFINNIAVEAEKMNHHPDIVWKYNEVKFTLTTHDKCDLTERDIALAKKINEIMRD